MDIIFVVDFCWPKEKQDFVWNEIGTLLFRLEIFIFLLLVFFFFLNRVYFIYPNSLSNSQSNDLIRYSLCFLCKILNDKYFKTKILNIHRSFVIFFQCSFVVHLILCKNHSWLGSSILKIIDLKKKNGIII